MGFHETRFPLSIAYGSSGGPGFNTGSTRLTGGRRINIPRWAQPLYKYNVASGIKSMADATTLITFYLARLGIANGFRFFDHLDHTSNADGKTDPTNVDQLIGTGDGVTTQFQLTKTYVHGSQSLVRTIRKPIHGETLAIPGGSKTYNTLVALNAVNLTESGNWSVDTTSGIITFNSAPGVGVAVSSGFAFDVPTWFGSELDELFASTHVDFETLDFGEILLEENRDDTYPHDEEVYYGGAKSHGTVNANFQINTAQGRVHTWTDIAGVKCILPDLAGLPGLGGPMFYLYNFFGTSTTNVYYSDGTTLVGTVPANTLAVVVAGVISGGTRVWLMR